MSLVRLSAFFKDDDGHGWSETHDKDTGGGAPDVTALLAEFDGILIAKRVPLLCADSFYIGCRVSFKTAQNQSAGDNIEHDPPKRGPLTLGGEDLNMGPPESAIKVRIRNAASTAKSDVYLRGFPRQCVLAGVLNFNDPIGAAWKGKADQYVESLKGATYGWVGINSATTSRGTVTGYVRQADGTVLFNLTPTNGVPLPAADTKLVIKFAKLNRSQCVLNRALVCTILAGGASAQCEEVIAVDDFANDGTFIAEQLAFVPYSAISYYRLSQRKTGRPFGVGPGRLPARILH